MNIQSMRAEMTDKRTKIIETAIELFVTQGLQQTSMAQLSQVSGVAVGTMYHHFKSKDVLIEAIFLYIQEDFGKSIELKGEDLDLPFEKRFELSFKKAFHYYPNHPNNFFFIDTHNYSPIIPRKVREEGRRFYQQSMDLLKEGVDSGTFIDIHPTLAIRWVYNSIVSLVQLKLNEDIEITDNMIDGTLKMTWKGLT